MAILVGSVEVDVVPNTARFIPQLRRQLVPQARDLGEKLGEEIGDGINRRIRERIGNPFENLPGATEAGKKAGTKFGGTFNDTVQAKVRAALKALPTPEIGVATTEAEQKLRDLRADLEALSDQRIGVDIDAAAASAEIARLQRELEQLGRESADVQVRADTAAAAAQLAALQAELSRINGEDVDVDVRVNTNEEDLNTFVGRLQALALAGAAIGPAIVPAAAAAVAGIGAIGPAAVAAGAGVGVLVLAFTGIADAVTATQAAQQSAAADAKTSADAQVAAANQVVSAQASVTASTRGLANAIAAADSAAIRSSEAVATARVAVATATQRAAVANAAALASYQAAEQRVQAAVRDSAQAQRDLTQAREDAQRQLEDLASQVANGALDERAGVLAVTEAQDALNKARVDPKATATSLADAQLAYDRAKQQLEDTRTRNARLAKDKADADKKGVEGSDLVTAAQKRVTDAVKAEQKARRDAATAAAKITQTRLDGIASIAKAEQGVTDALRAQADQARTSAATIVGAQASIASAQRSLETATKALSDAQSKQSTAAQKAADALAGLSPAGADFVKFVNGTLRPAFDKIRDAAQKGILPGVQKALTDLLPFLPGLVDFVGRLASVFGRLFERAGQALQAPFWRDFFSDLAKSIIPATETFARILANLATGFAGLLKAFLPTSKSLGDGLEKLTKRFADFSTGLSTNEGFQEFIDYATKSAPRVIDALTEIVKALVHILVAAAPIGTVVVEVLKLLAAVINAIPTPVLTVLLALLATYAIRLGVIWAQAKLVALYNGLAATATKAYRIAQAIANGTAKEAIIFNGRVAASLLLMKTRLIATRVATLAASAATVIAEGATAAWTIAVGFLDAALLANPIGLVVIAIVALIAIIVLVVKHFGFFKDIAVTVFDFYRDNWPKIAGILEAPFTAFYELVKTVFGGVKTGATAVVGFVVKVFGKLVEFYTTFNDAVNAVLGKVFDVFKSAARAAGRFVVDRFLDLVGFFTGLGQKVSAATAAAWDGIKSGARSAAGFVTDKFDTLVGFLKAIPGRLVDTFAGMWDGLKNGFKAAINTMIGWWNNLSFTIGGGTFAGVSIPSLTLESFPDIPFLAAGGVVNGPTVAMIGENGPEAVVPLRDSALLASLLGKASMSAGAMSGNDRAVTVNQTIVNPVPERASISGPAGLRRAALALGG